MFDHIMHVGDRGVHQQVSSFKEALDGGVEALDSWCGDIPKVKRIVDQVSDEFVIEREPVLCEIAHDFGCTGQF